MPLTASNKITKTTLRRERWECADPVYWRPGRDDRAYRLMTDDDRAALRKAFAEHGRLGVLDLP